MGIMSSSNLAPENTLNSNIIGSTPSISNGNASTNGSTEKPVSNIVALAQIISKETEKLDAYLKETNTPYPSFEFDGPLDFPQLPEHMQKTRQEIIRATSELRDLTVGPTESLRWMAWDVSVETRKRASLVLHEISRSEHNRMVLEIGPLN